MIGKIGGEILEKGLAGISAAASEETNKVSEIFKRIRTVPFKVLATFIAAPFLVFKVARVVDNPLRRAIAIIGLLLSLVLAYLAATFVGTLIGALFVMTHIGWLAGLGFLFGTTFSVFLSVIFSIIVFNSVSFLFLKTNSEEVLEHLRNQIK